ncbi:MAG: methylmalonyl-CoA mutase family protein [Myxococcota bacterium]
MSDTPETLNAFGPVAKATWIAKVEADLKGASFDSLRHKTLEGMTIEPLYTRADAPSADGGMPGLYPFLRGSSPLSGWRIRQEYDHPEVETCAAMIKKDLERGVEALHLALGPRSGCRTATVDRLDSLLESVDLAATSIHLDPGFDAVAVAAGLFALAERRGVGVDSLEGCLGADPLGRLARGGQVPGGLRARLAEIRGLGGWCDEHAPSLASICVSSDAYQEGGTSTTQELGAVLATGVAYLRELTKAGLSVDAAARQLWFAFPISGDFFGQVAKLRAARLLWAKVVTAAGGEPASAAMRIHARTSRFTKTKRDPWVNMLRSTAECTAAILGGAESIATRPFDAEIGTPDKLALRVARNTQFVLREESHLDAVVDPAGGSWFVEHLTTELARRAWEEFQAIEREGGLVAALASGRFTDAVDEVVDSERKRLAKRRTPVVGVSEFPNLGEDRVERPQVGPDEITRSLQATLDELDLGAHRGKLIAIARAVEAAGSEPAALIDACLGATLAGTDMYSIATVLQHGQPDFYVEPVPQWRQAEAWERLRDRSDAAAAGEGSRPQAFFANLGALPAHKARSTWASNLLAAGGIAAHATDGFDDAAAAASAYRESGCDLAIVCGSDADYERLLEPTVAALREAGCETLVVAGRPGDREEALREHGVTDFVFVGADVLSVVRRLLDAAGVSR